MFIKKIIFSAIVLSFSAALGMDSSTPNNPDTVTQANAITIIDVQGYTEQVSIARARILINNCSALEAYNDFDKGELDFQQSAQPTLTLKNINSLIDLIENPKIIDNPEKKLPLMELLQVANYLCAADNILYLLSNEVWPTLIDSKIQIASIDDEATKIEKNKQLEVLKKLRSIAEPHLSSPQKLLDFLYTTKIENIKKEFAYNSTLNVSSDAILQILKKKKSDCWYQDNAMNWYKIGYKFGNLHGIKELIHYLTSIEYYFKNIDLSNHYLTTFSLDQILIHTNNRSLENLNLSKNRITTVEACQFKEKINEFFSLDLSNNLITSVKNDFFDSLTKVRASQEYAFRFKVNIRNNLLTEAQKNEICQKFYNATHSLPERWISYKTYNRIRASSYALVTGAIFASSLLLAKKFFKSVGKEKYFFAGYLSFAPMYFAMSALDYLEYKISFYFAKKSHPSIATETYHYHPIWMDQETEITV